MCVGMGDTWFMCFSDVVCLVVFFFFSSRRRHTRYIGDWSSDVCSSDLPERLGAAQRLELVRQHLPLVVPRPLLLALLGDHLGGRPRDELLVGELGGEPQIGRASCRERVWGPVGGGSVKGIV